MNEIVCGIDLGTTYSAISYFDREQGRVVTVELVNAADGQREIRSVVYFPTGSGVVVGDIAYNARRQAPERVVVGVKRSMGLVINDPQDPARHGKPWTFEVDGRHWTAPEISAEILKVLLLEAESILGRKVEKVVITVPAYFGDAENSATIEAGKLAGVEVMGILPEPHAAALAFVADKSTNINERDLLVYDLGGGTFDVTLIRAEAVPIPGAVLGTTDRTIRLYTLCKDGNSLLGGLDWDQALTQLVAKKAMDQHGIDVLADPRGQAFVEEECEKAKRHLSRMGSVTVVVDLNGHNVEVSQAEFEDAARPLLYQTQLLMEQVLKNSVEIFQDRARTTGTADPASIDLDYVKAKVDVLLTGGSSKMPMVEAMLQQVTGRKPMTYGNPHLLVSMGAAWYAHLLQEGFNGKLIGPVDGGPKPTRKDSDPVPPGGTHKGPDPIKQDPYIVIVDTARESIGVAALKVIGRDSSGRETYEQVHAIVLPKGTPYGTSKVQQFAKSADGLTEIGIDVFCGEQTDLGQCRFRKNFTITDLPGTGRKGELVDVEFFYDKETCVLVATARDHTSGKVATVEIPT